MALLTQQEINSIEAATPTDWSKYDQQLSEQQQDTSGGRFALDERLHVKFFMRPKYNPTESAKQNRPIYEDTEFVEIMMPGEKHNIIVRPAASMRDDVRFHKQYAQFKAGVKEQMSGTPLKVLPFLSDALIEELLYFKIRTVEQLADLNDTVQFMGSIDLKNKAKRWLENTQSGETLAAQNVQQQKQIEELQAMVAKLMANQQDDVKSKPADDLLS